MAETTVRTMPVPTDVAKEAHSTQPTTPEPEPEPQAERVAVAAVPATADGAAVRSRASGKGVGKQKSGPPKIPGKKKGKASPPPIGGVRVDQTADAKFALAIEAAKARSNGRLSFRALRRGVIRAAAEARSAKVGTLVEGEVFEVLEEIVSGEGQRRVRMERGWVSVTSGSGKPLCVSEAACQLFLSSVPLLSRLTEAERAALADTLDVVEAQDGEVIVSEGTPGDAMFFVEEGRAHASKAGDVVMTYGRGEWF